MRRDTRGCYYTTAVTVTEHSTTRFGYAREIGRQVRTLREARRLLDVAGLPGYVQYWSERQQCRYVVADRDSDGNWTTTSPYTGAKEPLAD